MKIKNSIGSVLTELMAEKGISNKELAEVLGVAPSTVKRWKSGAHKMRLSKFIKVAAHLEVSTDYLMGRKR